MTAGLQVGYSQAGGCSPRREQRCVNESRDESMRRDMSGRIMGINRLLCKYKLIMARLGERVMKQREREERSVFVCVCEKKNSPAL